MTPCVNSLLKMLDSETFKALCTGVGITASWAILCFIGRCLKIALVRTSFKKCIEAHSGAGGADYRTGAFKVMIRNRTRWNLVIRWVAISSQPNCSVPLHLKHDPTEDITQLHRVTIPPEWGETWGLSLSEKVEPKCGFVKYESEGYFGGCVIRTAKFTQAQLEDIRKSQLAALDGQKRLKY